MADQTIEALVAIAGGDVSDALLFEVQRAGLASEKLTLAQLKAAVASQPNSYTSGEYYSPGDYSGPDLVGTSSMANGSLYAVIGMLDVDAAVQALAIRTGATITAGADAVLALASVDAATMKPKTLLAQTAQFACATASTNFEAALIGAPVTIPKGLVALLTMVSAGTTAVVPAFTLTSNAAVMRRLGSPTLAGAFGTAARTGWAAAGQTFPTIPTDLTALTWAADNVRCPKLRVKIA